MIIAIDFDGTCVTHEFPKVGHEIGAEIVLKRLVRHGHLLILNTMRSDKQKHGDTLTDAVNWFKDRDIPLYGVNENPDQKTWTSSPKAYANLYIDDAALGIPLVHRKNQRPYVDWERAEYLLTYLGAFN